MWFIRSPNIELTPLQLCVRICFFTVLKLIIMTKPKKKTRSNLPKISNYIGGPSELLPNEVPTLRDCLKKVLHIQQLQPSKTTYPKANIYRNVATLIIDAWQRSNYLFQPPMTISINAIAKRLKNAYDFIDAKVNKHRKPKLPYNFEQDLDSLFDILKCKCKMVDSKEIDKSDRSNSQVLLA